MRPRAVVQAGGVTVWSSALAADRNTNSKCTDRLLFGCIGYRNYRPAAEVGGHDLAARNRTLTFARLKSRAGSACASIALIPSYVAYKCREILQIASTCGRMGGRAR